MREKTTSYLVFSTDLFNICQYWLQWRSSESNLINSFWGSSIKCLNPPRRPLNFFHHLIAYNRENTFWKYIFLRRTETSSFLGQLLTFQILIIYQQWTWNLTEIILVDVEKYKEVQGLILTFMIFALSCFICFFVSFFLFLLWDVSYIFPSYIEEGSQKKGLFPSQLVCIQCLPANCPQPFSALHWFLFLIH